MRYAQSVAFTPAWSLHHLYRIYWRLNLVCRVPVLFRRLIQLDEIFSERQRAREQRPDSFAEQQIKLAKDGAKQLELLGQDLVQALQSKSHRYLRPLSLTFVKRISYAVGFTYLIRGGFFHRFLASTFSY